MASIGWGVIGCSDIVEKRGAAAIREQTNSELVAFHSRDKERAEAFAARFEAKGAYDDVESLLADGRIDAVYIANEVDRHAELTIAAANAGKHVLVEKPMALNTKQCLAMIDAAKRNGVRLSVAYYARFFHKAQVMKQVMEAGALGEIVRGTIRLMRHFDPSPSDPKYWRVMARAGGNILADIGSHRLDLFVYFLGRPRRVCGFVDRLTMTYEGADTETGLVQFENGAHVTVLASANTPASDRSTTMEIFGTRGALLMDPWSESPVEVLGSDMAPIPIQPYSNSHVPVVDDFVRAIVQGSAPRFSGVDGMWATTVIEGIYDSAATGKAVSVSDYVEGRL